MTRLTALLLLVLTPPLLAASSPRAIELRNQGFAELENERPEAAEGLYTELAKVVPDDPLPWANLAIAQLRQQKFDDAKSSIGKALRLTPDEAALLAIEGDVYQWSGDLDGALERYRRAVTANPNDPEVLYGLYNLATTNPNLPGAETAATLAIDRLAELRPENVVVLLQRGQRAIAAGDRPTASTIFNRIQELLWQAPPLAARAFDMVETALEGEDVSEVRVPALRLENVLKVTPMFRENLRELRTGIQGLPIERFRDEPQPTAFGEPLDIRFTTTSLDSTPLLAVAVGDLDADGTSDVVTASSDKLTIRLATDTWQATTTLPLPIRADGLLIVDLDNDGRLDIVAHGMKGSRSFRNGEDGFTTHDFGVDAVQARSMVPIDFDIEGDLDLAYAGTALGVLRNQLQGPLETTPGTVFPALA
ncbi:MAG: tetratricopeptide repeat protein, partial [Acidobacteriota bacterium]